MAFTRIILTAAALFAAATGLSHAQPNAADWDAVEKQAKGQTVYFNAWGGSQNINDYIAWAGRQMSERYGVTVEHVKLDDTANAVSTVIAEKSAGKNEGGRIDLIWINGENFVSMKEKGLLFSPGWADKLPNWRYVDFENNETITTDFTVPVEGLEAPWGGAKLVFFHDSARKTNGALPNDFAGLVKWTEANPGRLSYPAPPDFIGSSFLKQALIEMTSDPAVLQKPAGETDAAAVLAPLFAQLDAMHPNLWRGGKAFPKNYPAMTQMLADGELDIIFAFNPADASAAIEQNRLPDTVRSFTFDKGTLGNTHFLAIPYNANAKAGALVLANFLMSPEAQAHKQNPAVWGDPTILAIDKLEPADKARFENLDLGIATLPPEKLGPKLSEPHPSWMEAIEKEWTRRYAAGN